MCSMINCVFIAMVLIMMNGMTSFGYAREFRAGFAERDITPKAGMEMPGGYGKAFHTGNIHDPCKVRAVVFDDGDTRAALVGIDACSVYKIWINEARQEIFRRCGISPEAIVIGASHTHSGGPTEMVQPGQFDNSSRLVQKLAYELSPCADPDYIAIVRNAIIEAVVEAYQKCVPAKACVGSGRAENVAFNRRLRMKDGLTYTHPGKGNPDILGFAYPADPEVGVIGVWSENGRFLGCVVNFACHGTTGPGGTSADWIYYLERTIRGVMGEDAVVVFLNGASGDVTQINNLSPYATDRGERSARFVGTNVGAEALKVLTNAEPGNLVPVACKTKMLRIPRRKPSPERIQHSLEIIYNEKAGTAVWTFAKELLIADALIENEPIAEFEIQAIQIGPAVFLANPAEYFCQLGLDIKRESQFPFTYIISIANDYIGYVPTEESFGPHGGGYETRLTSCTNLSPDAGAIIARASLELAHSLQPGQAPLPPKAQNFKEPWNYGNVPPELK